MTIRRKIVKLIMASLLAFMPLLLATQATALSKEEQVAAAQANLDSAKQAYAVALERYNSLVSVGSDLKIQLDQAQANLENAQLQYNQSSIPDPAWVRPLKEETYTVQVPYTVEVPYVVQETTTSQVARTIQVPHTSMITESVEVAREVITVIPSGLTAESYNMQGYNNAPPLPGSDRLVSTETVENINFNWGGGYVLSSGRSEDVAVKFSGNISIPISGTYTLYAPGDDGIKVIINNNTVINDWYDKGGGGSTIQVNLEQGVYPFTLWFYENGGGANVWFYWIIPGGPGWEIVPASAFGEQTQTTIVYETVTVEREVTTYTEEIVYDTVETVIDVTYYREEARYREEERVRLVPDESAEHPRIKDPALLPAISNAQSEVSSIESQITSNQSIIDSANSDVNSADAAVKSAQASLDTAIAIPEPTPTKEPTPQPEPIPTLEPKPEISETPKPLPSPEPPAPILPEKPAEIVSELLNVEPEKLTDSQVEQLVEAALETFKTADPGSAEYQQALEALAVAAEADDIELPQELAAIPLIGDVAGAALEVFNNVGNIGADMAPQTREKAEKTIIASVIAAQAAIGAVQAATSAATAAASTASGGTTRRN